MLLFSSTVDEVTKSNQLRKFLSTADGENILRHKLVQVLEEHELFKSYMRGNPRCVKLLGLSISTKGNKLANIYIEFKNNKNNRMCKDLD